MRISIYDGNDDLIGATEIDIEDRWHTKYYARIGLSKEYSQFGYNIWRDKYRPSEILANICRDNGLQPPMYYSNSVIIAGVPFVDTTKVATNEDLKERLAISALKKINTVPLIGYTLVPEHVETRSLYKQDGLEYGKLQLWVELHDKRDLPLSIDITPEPPQNLEIRLIIWSTAEVILNEKKICGKQKSDIYVKWY